MVTISVYIYSCHDNVITRPRLLLSPIQVHNQHWLQGSVRLPSRVASLPWQRAQSCCRGARQRDQRDLAGLRPCGVGEGSQGRVSVSA